MVFVSVLLLQPKLLSIWRMAFWLLILASIQSSLASNSSKTVLVPLLHVSVFFQITNASLTSTRRFTWSQCLIITKISFEYASTVESRFSEVFGQRETFTKSRFFSEEPRFSEVFFRVLQDVNTFLVDSSVCNPFYIFARPDSVCYVIDLNWAHQEKISKKDPPKKHQKMAKKGKKHQFFFWKFGKNFTKSRFQGLQIFTKSTVFAS